MVTALALLLTVELISRVPVHHRWLGSARLLATSVIAAIAAWISYRHMVGVATRYGESGAAPYLLPFSVDGLIVVASISLVELAAHIRTAAQAITGSPLPPVEVHTGASTDEERFERVEATEGFHQDVTTAQSAGQRSLRQPERPSASGHSAANAQPADGVAAVSEVGGATAVPADPDPVPGGTAAAVAYWYERDPSLHPGVIAEKIGRSERTVRRHWPPAARTEAAVSDDAPPG